MKGKSVESEAFKNEQLEKYKKINEAKTAKIDKKYLVEWKALFYVEQIRYNMYKLLELYNEEMEIVNPLFEEDYPFQHSFDEVLADVGEWLESAKRGR